ncbi:hypothetical protein BBJ28_00001523 [Nothophytophthora sp. Chile5]|nr:hypothetical protein BBJ28_00001523 [Nothophytophthora sp. Chile5]
MLARAGSTLQPRALALLPLQHSRLVHIAQRHSRELLERDFNTLKQDIRMLEKIDFDKIRMEIAELEKKFLLQKQAEDETLNELRLSMEKVEKRMLQYAVGFAGTIMAVGAALMRLCEAFYENSELRAPALSLTREVAVANFEALPKMLPSTPPLPLALLLVGFDAIDTVR